MPVDNLTANAKCTEVSKLDVLDALKTNNQGTDLYLTINVEVVLGWLEKTHPSHQSFGQKLNFGQ